jgi:glycerol-3-phosphate dehydrogenase
MFVYDGGVLNETHTAEICLPEEELRSWAWCTRPEAQERLSDLLARRATAALQSRAAGVTLYLENGHLMV